MLLSQFLYTGKVVGEELENNRCYALPSTAEARICEISSSPGCELNFSSFWKSSYGYHIPNNINVFIKVVFPGFQDREPYVYPACCILQEAPIPLPRGRSHEHVCKNFLKSIENWELLGQKISLQRVEHKPIGFERIFNDYRRKKLG
ncbi:uncharacterized protein LOC135122418 [Zophobas morio]|uniref:uncharacterized protein LOC135122418 n=1 Tax=Zophobas morio TaxID=2755281 RepID=UPI00308384B6